MSLSGRLILKYQQRHYFCGCDVHHFPLPPRRGSKTAIDVAKRSRTMITTTTATTASSTVFGRSLHRIYPIHSSCRPLMAVYTGYGTAVVTRTSRWISDTGSDDSSFITSTEIDKNHTKPKETPKLTVAMKEELVMIEKRFLRFELEPHGRRRGIEVAQQMIREEKLEKRATKAVANTHLNNWIYKRYSLALGYAKITDVPSEVLANTLIRQNTTIRFWKYKNPKTILKEMYRYPQRPTSMQQRYIEKDAKAIAAESSVDGNTDTTKSQVNDNNTLLTPEEEERERLMWDPRLFAPKPYGYKARRDAKKLKKELHMQRQMKRN